MNDSKLLVYYLDDEELLLEAFMDRFTTVQIEIMTFSNYMDFEKAFSQKTPDVVVLDYTMPIKNGEQVARSLPSHLPKILVTGNLDQKSNSFFDHVFEKPYPEEAIENYLSEKLKAKNSSLKVG